MEKDKINHSLHFTHRISINIIIYLCLRWTVVNVLIRFDLILSSVYLRVTDTDAQWWADPLVFL